VSRSEGEIVGKLLEVSVGGLKKPLRILSMRESKIWKASLVGGLSTDIGKLELRSAEDIGPVVDVAADKILDLVVGYDVDGTLGGREWLEDHATDEEIYLVLRRCLEASFPFVKDLRSALSEVQRMGLADLLSSATSRSESSTNGASPVGVSASTES
jgi:hypothetical protein